MDIYYFNMRSALVGASLMYRMEPRNKNKNKKSEKETKTKPDSLYGASWETV